MVIMKSSDCVNLKSRNDIYETEFYKADDYFLEKKLYSNEGLAYTG